MILTIQTDRFSHHSTMLGLVWSGFGGSTNARLRLSMPIQESRFWSKTNKANPLSFASISPRQIYSDKRTNQLTKRSYYHSRIGLKFHILTKTTSNKVPFPGLVPRKQRRLTSHRWEVFVEIEG